MAHVTILGAGLVAGPVVRHILERSSCRVTVAAQDFQGVGSQLEGHPRGTMLPFDVEDVATLDRLVAESDVVVSMLPYVHHVAVAQRCLVHRRHLVTSSYVQPAMRALDAEAKARGVTLLNELGLDPGIDHMSAMRIVHDVRRAGGRITSFRSYCGGLPAPEANTNPFGYKFSWSPRGVVLAARNAAKYLSNGREVLVPGSALFAAPEAIEIAGVGRFEGYPNRDATAYIPLYGLDGIQTMFRGTLRNLGHCATWHAMGAMGLYDDTPQTFDGGTFRHVMARLGEVDVHADVEAAVAARAHIARDAEPIQKLTWLGMFSNAPLPVQNISPLDALVARMITELQYAPGERDMVVLQHDFIAEYPDRRAQIRSTLVDYGIPHGETAMSRTVGLPAAIGALRLLDGTITARGVVVPVEPAVYTPILDELAALGLRFHEETLAL